MFVFARFPGKRTVPLAHLEVCVGQQKRQKQHHNHFPMLQVS